MKQLMIALLLCVAFACNSTSQSIQNLTVQQFAAQALAADVQLIDVRTPDEYESGHIGSSKNMDVNSDEFATLIEKLDKSKPVYVYCKSGGRSATAASEMAKAGFKTIFNLDGGIMAWRAAAQNLVTDNNAATQKKEGMSMAYYKKMVNQNTPVLVEFYAPWCGPCKVLKPIVEKIGEEQKGKMQVVFVNVDDNTKIADSLKLASIPVLMYYEKGKKKWTTIGAPSESELRKKLKI